MTANVDFRVPLLAGAMVVAFGFGGIAQAGCGGDHSVSAEVRAPLQSTAQLETEAQLEPAETVDDEAAATEVQAEPEPMTEVQAEPEATIVVEAEPEPEPTTVERSAPRVVHVVAPPQPKPVPAVPFILGTYR